MKINFNDTASLKEDGFIGFMSVSSLTDKITSIPNQMGVYMVISEEIGRPEFILKGTGGFFKGIDPNVSLEELKLNWVENTKVIYIGKAGGGTSSSTLRKRVNDYLRFGKGKPAGHKGGRLIWQIKNSANLVIYWKPLTSVDPREYEKLLIAEFRSCYNTRPFANLTD